MTTQDRLSEIEARLNAATPGEWEVVSDLPCYAIIVNNKFRVVETKNQHNWDSRSNNLGIGNLSNAELIAHAPTDLRKLLQCVRVLLDTADFYRKGNIWIYDNDCGRKAEAALAQVSKILEVSE